MTDTKIVGIIIIIFYAFGVYFNYNTPTWDGTAGYTDDHYSCWRC